MPFNSFKYLLFLPVVYLVFYFVGERARWFVLLVASLLFYAALNVPYLLVVLVLVALTTFGFGIWLDQAETPKAKRALLWGGVAVNVVILVVMKYLPFLSENLRALAAMLTLETQIEPVKVLATIGVSYYVFQAISYLFDIYLEIAKPERQFGYFALYLAFFPKLLQGPIERAGDLIPQFKRSYEFNYDNMRLGMLLIAWGLFKKVVIADRLGLYVDAVYGDVHSYTGVPLLLATYAYAFQIYMDFSGYTDMALGSARLFNIQLTQNFNSPYLATSIIDFWRRWHITFSRWILGYIFNPLQMQWRNWKNWSTPAALMVAFLISGIWHGASWGFVIWGCFHGMCMASSSLYKPYQKKLHRALRLEKTSLLKVWQVVVTFNLVSFAWVFFRAKDLGESLLIVQRIFHLSAQSISSGIIDFLQVNGHTTGDMAVLLLCMAIFAGVSYFRIHENSFHNKQANAKVRQCIAQRPRWIRWCIYYALILTIIIFGVFAESQFIYFRF